MTAVAEGVTRYASKIPKLKKEHDVKSSREAIIHPEKILQECPKPIYSNDDIKKISEHLHSLCSLFHKISYQLDGDCRDDVGEQALNVFVMISGTFDQKEKKTDALPQLNAKSTLTAETQKRFTFIDDLLSLKEVDQLESLELENIKLSLRPLLQNSLTDILVNSKKWTKNVLYLLGLDYTKFNSKILECPFGELVYIQRQIERIWEDTFDENDGNNLTKCLEALGFSPSASQDIESTVPKSLKGCQSSLYWSIRYLKYKLFNDPLLTYAPRYPYQNDKINEWFKEIIGDCEVNMFNASIGDSLEMVSSIVKATSEDQNFELFYHGTSHSDAVSILEMGVQLSMGSILQDFSSGDGFYLYDNLQSAQKWASAGRDSYQAVIVYKLNLNECKEGLKLDGHEAEWQNIVNLCRNPNANKFERMDLLQNLKFIRGPVCRNPITAIKKGTKFQTCKISQLCIRDKAFANNQCSTKNICGVIFYN